MAKFLYLVEFVREEYITKLADGTAKVDWINSEEGSLFQEIIEKVGLTIEEFDIDFVYKKVPDPKKYDRDGNILSYKDPKQAEVAPYQALITKKILENDYDLVIPTGKLGLYLTEGNTRAITRNRGSQEHVTVRPIKLSDKQIESADSKVLNQLEGLDDTLVKDQWIYPVFSVSYVMTRVNNLRILLRDMETVKQVSDKGTQSLVPSETAYKLLTNMGEVRELFAFLKENQDTLTTAWDLETNTLKPEMEGAKVLLTSISWGEDEHEEGNAVTIPLEKEGTPFNPEEQQEILNLLKEFLASDTLKATANGKFDIRFMMMAYGFEEFKNVVDIQTAFYLTVVQDKTVSRSLANLAFDYTDMGGYDNELEKFKRDYIKEYKKEHGSNPINDIDGGNFNYDWIPLDIMHPYASGDVDATLRIYWKMKKNIDSSEKWKYLFYQWYPQLDVALSRVETNGMYMDTDYLDVIDEEYSKEVERLVEEMRELPSVKQLEEENKMFYEAGLKEMGLKPKERNEAIAKLRNKYKGDKQKFNPNSPDHKARVLYDIMGAEVSDNFLKDSASGKPEDEITWRDYSTDKHSLQEMKKVEEYSEEINKMAKLLEEYSSVKTLRNNFVVKYPPFISKKTGAIHANFHSTGTDTTRLSSSDPNLQQIKASHGDTKKFDYQHPIKRLFTTRFENGAILEADYSSLNYGGYVEQSA